MSKDERIDLTQFEGHGFREVITQNRHEYEEGFPPATVEVNISEGIAFAPPPLDEKLVSWGGHKVWMSGKDANVIQHFDSLIAELKRCYEELDRPKVTIDDWDKAGPCVTVYLEGKEYVGILREYNASE